MTTLFFPSGDEDDEHVNVVDGEEEDMMQTPKRRRLQQEHRNVLEEGKKVLHHNTLEPQFCTFFFKNLWIMQSPDLMRKAKRMYREQKLRTE